MVSFIKHCIADIRTKNNHLGGNYINKTAAGNKVDVHLVPLPPRSPFELATPVRSQEIHFGIGIRISPELTSLIFITCVDCNVVLNLMFRVPIGQTVAEGDCSDSVEGKQTTIKISDSDRKGFV